jgi:anti-sigma28 factor (negative regulator of flagellin synthesis)
MVEAHAWVKPRKRKNAMTRHAQSTAYGNNGEAGPSAHNHAVEELRAETESAKVPSSEDRNAKVNPLKQLIAAPASAQLMESSFLGLTGASATHHAVVAVKRESANAKVPFMEEMIA